MFDLTLFSNVDVVMSSVFQAWSLGTTDLYSSCFFDPADDKNEWILSPARHQGLYKSISDPFEPSLLAQRLKLIVTVCNLQLL